MGSFVTYRTNPVVVEFGEEMRALEDPVPPEFVREFQESTLARPVPPPFSPTLRQCCAAYNVRRDGKKRRRASESKP